MAQEFELIKQLEIEVKKQTGKKLNKYSLDYKRVKNLNSFTVDPGGECSGNSAFWNKKHGCPDAHFFKISTSDGILGARKSCTPPTSFSSPNAASISWCWTAAKRKKPNNGIRVF